MNKEEASFWTFQRLTLNLEMKQLEETEKELLLKD